MTVYNSFNPTSLFAGDRQHLHRVISLAGGQNAAPVNGIATPLLRGTVLGRSSGGEAVASVKASGPNTGNGTITMDASTPVLAAATAGIYTVRMTAATTFNVNNPAGTLVAAGTVGTAFTTQIKFNTAAGGTAFVAGDGFDIFVDAQDSYVVSKSTAVDGSNIPVAVLAYDTDTSAGALNTPAYFEGEYAAEICIFDASWTIATLQAVTRQNNIPLFFRSVGTAP